MDQETEKKKDFIEFIQRHKDSIAVIRRRTPLKISLEMDEIMSFPVVAASHAAPS